MEAESFEDEEAAALLNEHYVSIKAREGAKRGEVLLGSSARHAGGGRHVAQSCAPTHANRQNRRQVDREERPDVDRVYMTYVQALTGRGGWPMSVWLTPGLEPIMGATYLPPAVRAQGRVLRVGGDWERVAHPWAGANNGRDLPAVGGACGGTAARLGAFCGGEGWSGASLAGRLRARPNA